MFTSFPVPWLVGLTAFASLTVAAQNTPAPARAPVATTAPSTQPALAHQSAMEGYKAFKDEKPIPWTAANALVEQRGGWRAYAQEASEDAPGEMSETTPRSAQSAHSGHAMPEAPAKEKP